MAWLVEGSDRSGRRASRDGGDPDRQLAECAQHAARIDREPATP